jgi:hypothetical protein
MASLDHFYDVHVIGGTTYAIDWSSGDQLQKILEQTSFEDYGGRSAGSAFFRATTVEGGEIQIAIMQIEALAESTPDQRKIWQDFKKRRKADGEWEE